VDRLLEEEEHMPFLARILTVAQSLAVVLVLGHSEVPLLVGGALAVRVLVAMALSVLIVTVVAADYCLIRTMQRIPVLARRNQWILVGAYVAYALFVGLVEISTYAVVLSILDRDPGALLRASPLLPTAGLIFIAQVVLRAALIFWTMVQLFLTARKLPVQPNTLTDHSAELLGGKALQLIKELDTDHADLPMIFQAYAASVETAARGSFGLLGGWGPFRKRADALTSARRERWADLIATLRQFSSVRHESFGYGSASGHESFGYGSAPAHEQLVSELAPATGDLPVAASNRSGRQMRSAALQRREFMEQHEASFVRVDGSQGDWLGASAARQITRRRVDGRLGLSEDRARKMVRAIGDQKKTAGGRMMYVVAFDQMMQALAEANLLDDESLSWWTNYRDGRQIAGDG
jgi:hypothetical protein